MERQLVGVFQRVLRLHQCASGRVAPIGQPGGEEAERGAATECGERVAFGVGQRPDGFVGGDHGGAAGEVKVALAREAPGVEADG